MMTNYRIALLIKLLSKHDQPISSKTICHELNIKPRTLRDDISRFRQSLHENGIEIASKHGVGYELVIINETHYYAFIKTLLKDEQRRHFVLPVQAQERINYLIRTFLSADDYVKLDDIADDIYISRSTLNHYLKSVRDELTRFNLHWHSKPGYGIKVVGNELDLRQAIARYFFYDDNYQQLLCRHDQDNTTRANIRSLLIEVLAEHKIKLTDLGFQNLIIHLEIALMRITKNHYNHQISDEYRVLEKRSEFAVARQLAHNIAKHFTVTLPEPEIYFITIHLMGKRSFNHDNAFVITPETEQLFNQIFDHINAVFKINFSEDFELYTLLALHFKPMLDRLAYKLNINNPMLEQIKEQNVKAFDIAVLSGQVIHQQTGLIVNEAEIGYMAIHFALALERQKQIHTKRNIIIVCASGMGSSQLLLYRIKQRFGHYIEQMKVVPLYELQHFDQQTFDYIISTVDIPFKTHIPILRVHYFLDNHDELHVERCLSNPPTEVNMVDRYFSPKLFFTDLQSQGRFDLIGEMCQKITQTIPIGDDFVQLVIEREKLAATEFGNGIAFPHPIHHYGIKTFVSVAILAKPIKWDKQCVRYIFMLNIRHDEHDSLQLLHESLVNLMSDNQKLKQLDNDPTFDTLTHLLKLTVNEAEQTLQHHSFK